MQSGAVASASNPSWCVAWKRSGLGGSLATPVLGCATVAYILIAAIIKKIERIFHFFVRMDPPLTFDGVETMVTK